MNFLCLNLNDGFTKSLLKLWHGLEITNYMKPCMGIISYPFPNLSETISVKWTPEEVFVYNPGHVARELL